jgi:L-asparaginase
MRRDAVPSGPYVAVLSTGGTIAMQHDETAGGAVPQLGASDFAAALPPDAPRLHAEEIVNLPSSHFTLETLERIRDRVAELVEEPDVLGVVVTHGTDTMEETTYLLDLTVPGAKPVVLTGAMRTASDVGYDGYANLLAAVRVAATPQARDLGAVIVFNGEIHAAGRATKMHTLSPATFQSPGWGPIGRVEGDAVIVDRRPEREGFPWRGLERHVALLKLTVGAGPGALEDALQRGARGVVIEGLGAGRVPPWWLPVVRRARERGIPVVIASRCPSGRVWDQYGYAGAYRSLVDLGCLFTAGINGQKARIRLMVILAAAETPEGIAALWRRQ